jgi:UDP-hydrolysing UDP-N-acetyl-D-glucosamine 2-epimerase
VTGAHLSKKFGYTIKDIEKDNFRIDYRIPLKNYDDTGASMANFVGEFTIEMVNALKDIKPSILFVGFDIGAHLAAAIAATYMAIPIAHLHGGEISGSVDESIRHALTKLSHIHFATTDKNAERLIKMGEEPWRVFIVGAPSLDTIIHKKLLDKEEIEKKYGVNFDSPVIIILQHPVVTEINESIKQFKETIEASQEVYCQKIIIYPNADGGSQNIVREIEKIERTKDKNIKIFKSFPHKDFLSLLKHSSVLVGNSSSGIIEAPSFKLPVVNVGTRQERRQRAENVIDVGYNKQDIKEAIEKALYDEKFKNKVKSCGNPYGDGKASVKIAEVLTNIDLDERLISKKMTY